MTVGPNSSGRTADETWTVGRVIEWTTAHLGAHGSETPRLDSEILLAHARGCERIELYTRFNEPLSEDERGTMRDLVRRRARSEPVAYLVGHREFFSLDFRVTPDVLIPRPQTEVLVAELLDLARASREPKILDVGTGSGCIAIAAAVQCKQAVVTGTDISAEAIAVARENAERHRVAERVQFQLGDLFEPVAEQQGFDMIASNPPYVGEDEIETLQPDVRLHEPHLALVAGQGGLAVLRRIVDDAPRHLVPGGRLLLEISPEQADNVQAVLHSHGAYSDIKVINDLAGRARVISARVDGETEAT